VNKHDIINSILEEWADEFIGDLQAAAAAKLKDFTGEGKRSFNVALTKAAVGKAAQVTIGFAEHLRYFDMKKVQRSKGFDKSSLERIKAWVQKRGISAFMKGYTQPTTYKYKPGTVPETRIINNIAWGISRKKKRFKRRAWYAARKNAGIRDVYLDLVEALIPVMIDEMKVSMGARK
jgi:hypothetical protein